MTFVVPFDASPLAKTALARAETLAEARDTDIVAIAVVPRDADYAKERGWLADDESFDASAIRERIGEAVREVAPDAEFRCDPVDSYMKYGEIARRLRDMARETDASVVFLGSQNVGRIAKPISSIGSNVAARTDYDIYLVRQVDPRFDSG